MQPPGIAAAQVHLLHVDVELALGEEMRLTHQLLGQQRDLRQRRRMSEPRRLGRQRLEARHPVIGR
jgi:hypothetical protein